MTGPVRRFVTSKWSLILTVILLGVSAAMFTVAVVRTVDEQRKMHDFTQCLAEWADASTARTTMLSAASTARNDALDGFVRSLTTQDRVKELAAYNAYLKASDEYKRQSAANPAPAPPKLRC